MNSSSSDWPYKGQCLCGQVRYEAAELNSKMGHCHCTMCRKFHGAAFSTFAAAPINSFRWLSGEGLLSVFTADNGSKRKFCRVCGSSLVFESAEENGFIEFSLATLDQYPELKPDAHIYLSTKVDWLDVTDDLPKHQNGRT